MSEINYHVIKVQCSCGAIFETRSTYKKDELSIDVCSACHPFYTGQQKIVGTAGRYEKFMNKYGMKKPAADKSVAPEEKSDQA